MATVPSRKIDISELQDAISKAQARNFTTVCIGEVNGDIVVGKDVADAGKPRELEGEAATDNGTDIELI